MQHTSRGFYLWRYPFVAAGVPFESMSPSERAHLVLLYHAPAYREEIRKLAALGVEGPEDDKEVA
jgi:hypothetical protein